VGGRGLQIRLSEPARSGRLRDSSRVVAVQLVSDRPWHPSCRGRRAHKPPWRGCGGRDWFCSSSTSHHGTSGCGGGWDELGAKSESDDRDAKSGFIGPVIRWRAANRHGRQLPSYVLSGMNSMAKALVAGNLVRRRRRRSVWSSAAGSRAAQASLRGAISPSTPWCERRGIGALCRMTRREVTLPSR